MHDPALKAAKHRDLDPLLGIDSGHYIRPRVAKICHIRNAEPAGRPRPRHQCTVRWSGSKNHLRTVLSSGRYSCLRCRPTPSLVLIDNVQDAEIQLTKLAQESCCRSTCGWLGVIRAGRRGAGGHGTRLGSATFESDQGVEQSSRGPSHGNCDDAGADLGTVRYWTIIERANDNHPHAPLGQIASKGRYAACTDLVGRIKVIRKDQNCR